MIELRVITSQDPKELASLVSNYLESVNGTPRTSYSFSSGLYFAFVESRKETEPTQTENKIPQGFSLESYLVDVEKECILKALTQNDNNLTRAAENLGITFRNLRYKVKKLKIDLK